MKMSKYFLLSLLLICAYGRSSAQCTPDTSIKVAGFYPGQLDTGDVNVAYQEVIQAFVPKDTIVTLAGNKVKVFLDSIVVVKVLGLPAGFTLTCHHPKCWFLANNVSCATVAGTSPSSGIWPLQMVIRTHGKVAGIFAQAQLDTITRFVLVIGRNFASTLPVEQGKMYVFRQSSGKPVLVNGDMDVRSVSVYRLTGQKIGEWKWNEDIAGRMELPLSLESNQLYLLRYDTPQGVHYLRF